MFGRQKVATILAEFLSAGVLSIVVLSMVGRTSFPFFAAIAAGATVATMAYLFGSHSNPAVTIGMWTMRKVNTLTAVVLVVAQMLGGVAAWRLNEYLLNNELQNIAGETFDWRILIAEALGAFVLGLGVATAVGKGLDKTKQALVGGVSLGIGIIVAAMVSNGLVNPAVAVGVQSWSWAYALGPVLGVVVGMSLYGLLFADKAPKFLQSKVKTVSKKKKPARKPAKRKK